MTYHLLRRLKFQCCACCPVHRMSFSTNRASVFLGKNRRVPHKVVESFVSRFQHRSVNDCLMYSLFATNLTQCHRASAQHLVSLLMVWVAHFSTWSHGAHHAISFLYQCLPFANLELYCCGLNAICLTAFLSQLFLNIKDPLLVCET
jgi:hypothetical protein